MSRVFCKYFGYFPPPALDYCCLLSHCCCCDKYSKTPFLAGQVKNIFKVLCGRRNITLINKGWMDWQIIIFELPPHSLVWMSSASRLPFLSVCRVCLRVLMPCCCRCCCSGRLREAWGESSGVGDRAASMPRQTQPLLGWRYQHSLLLEIRTDEPCLESRLQPQSVVKVMKCVRVCSLTLREGNQVL